MRTWTFRPTIWLFSGLGTWLFGRPSLHLGASGIAHGLMFFLFVIGHNDQWRCRAINPYSITSERACLAEAHLTRAVRDTDAYRKRWDGFGLTSDYMLP